MEPLKKQTKHLCKAVAPKRLCFKPVPQSYSPKRLPKAASQTCSLKLLPKDAHQSCGSSKLPCKAAPQDCSPLLFPCAAPQSCAQSFSPKLLPKAAESCSQSCCWKLLPKLLRSKHYSPKVLPKAAVLQSCGSSKLPFFKAAVHSCSLKLAAPQSCSLRFSTKLCPKLFSKAFARKLRFCKPVYQNVSPKPFCKAAPESCAPNLLSLPPSVSCFRKRLLKVAF